MSNLPLDVQTKVERGERLDRDALDFLTDRLSLVELAALACQSRDYGHGDIITYSRKVFIPLTELCRDVCHYCTFAKTPRRIDRPYMTLEQASQVVDLMTSRISSDANVIMGARQDPGFGDTIKVMAIITGVARDRLLEEQMNADRLGEALGLAGEKDAGSRFGFQRFD